MGDIERVARHMSSDRKTRGAETVVTPLGNGVYQVDDGRRCVAYAAGPADARWVFLDGRAYVVDAAARGSVRRRVRGHDEGALAAPMPGTVLTIAVEPGQRVSKGDVLIMLEAMKMELPIKAPRDAMVKAIACKPGELVQAGVPLLELE
jgi:biotin carboxyl carrier protein